MRTYSTGQVAAMIGVHWVTLRRWLAAKKVRPSIAIPLEGRTLWRWTDDDLEAVRQYKTQFYRKGRGRKPAGKISGSR
jgi:hypothetical protein